MSNLQLFVTGHKGFETLLFHEIRAILEPLPAVLRKAYGGVKIDAGIDAVYRICLHSRLANRLFCELAHTRIENDAQLYQAVSQIDWNQQFEARASIAVAATLSRSKLNHGQYAAQVVKDAIVDQFRAACGSRPSVSKRRPDIQLHINIHQNQAQISLDLSGESLHRRGYRLQHAGAPLKEHLAAALLAQAGWNRAAADDHCFIDPLCGSGTFIIEAAQIAAGMAPGLTRDYFGFLNWRHHQPDRWRDWLEQARQAVTASPRGRIYASDCDPTALEIARANAARAQISEWIEFSQQRLADVEIDERQLQRLVVCNPPYGKRLARDSNLDELYHELGAFMRRLAPARLAIISDLPERLHGLQLFQSERKPVRNGPLQCVFAIYTTEVTPAPAAAAPDFDAAAAEPLANRLRKNARHLERWAARNGVSCYRVYDADLPEFAFALDRYRSALDPAVEWFHLQEYQAPASIDAAKAARRIALAAEVVKFEFGLSDERLYRKLRSRQRGAAQYQKQAQRDAFFPVCEGEARLLINLSDYLDSGLFLDHRATRALVARLAQNKSVLNLFCYTASFGVAAALGGAASVLNVDLSPTYLNWAQENFRLNRLDDATRYQFLRADIIELLQRPHQYSLKREYDLIFFDPPSFSNSSKMEQNLDIQRDHRKLISQAMSLLAADGLMLFSTNKRSFKLDAAIESEFALEDITRATITEDFKRRPRVHRCWEIRHVK